MLLRKLGRLIQIRRHASLSRTAPPLWGYDPKTGLPIKRDVGQYQINTIVHADELKKLHLDVVNSADDNALFADILYKRNGLKDWSASRTCWQEP